jgi:hypothetical protein
MKDGLPNSDLACGESEFATPFMRSSETHCSYVNCTNAFSPVGRDNIAQHFNAGVKCTATFQSGRTI